MFVRSFLHTSIIICFVIFTYLTCQAESLSKIDSLNKQLAITSSTLEQTELLLAIAAAYKNVSMDSIKAYLDQAETLLAQNPENSDNHKRFLVLKAKFLNDQGRSTDALEYLEVANSLLDSNEITDISLRIQSDLAETYRRTRQYDKALAASFEALKSEQKKPNSEERGFILGTIAVLYRQLKDIEKADEYYKLTLENYQQMKDTSKQVRTLAEWAVVKGLKGGRQAAYDAFQEAMKVGGSSIDQMTKARLYKDLAMTSALLGNAKTASDEINKAIELSKEISNESLEIDFRIAECLVLSKTNRCNQMISKVATLRPIVEKRKNNRWKELLLILETDCHMELNNYKAATITLKERLKLQDSIFRENVASAVSNAEVKYETEKKEADIEKLELQEKLNSAQISRQRIALGGSIIGLSVLSFLLYQLFGQKRKIETQNSVIAKALDEKETLLKEIHHRVKNNLQVVSSLLRIQSNQTDDEVAVDALKEGQSRVQSMSLIHQDLYQHDNLKGINMRDYLERLTTGLFNTYNIAKDRITIETEIDDLQLDVDSVVPLGLIINELVTNSLKYAFPNDRSGQIKVSLQEQDDHLILSVVDNGIGIDKSKLEDSFGQGLVQAFANKLDADISIENENGTQIVISISDYQKV